MERFVECIEVKWLYKTFPQQPMTGLSDTFKREHRAAEKCHICLKEFNDPSNRKVRDHCHYIGLYRGVVMTLICSSRKQEGDLIKMILGSLQRTRRNKSVLTLKLMSSCQRLSIRIVHKCMKMFSFYRQLQIYGIKPR